MEQGQGISRRKFMTGAAAAGALAALGLAGCAPQAQGTSGAAANAAGVDASTITWDEECDVLVVGTGYAGMAAALEAKNAGVDVKIIEKRSLVGGNSAIAAGDFAVCNTEQQKKEGIEDSVDSYVQDMLVAGLYLNDEEKCRIIAEKSNETWEWTVAQGVPWGTTETGETWLIPYGGHSVIRTVAAADGGGNNVIKALNTKLEEAGTKVETGRMLTGFIADENGRVVGVRVQDGTRNNDPTSGSTVHIQAKKGVVLATGGFGADATWRIAHDPRLNDTVDCTNQPDATGESLRAAMTLGALPVHLDWIQMLPFMSPDETAYGCAAFYTDANASYAPTIDVTTGKRIVNELTDRKRYADAILETGKPCVQVTCEKTQQALPEDIEKAMSAGVTHKFDTLPELAEFYGLDLTTLQETLERYNSFLASGVDEDFGKTIPADANAIDEGPYYGVRLWPKVHHCMGGVKTNVDCQVLDLNLNVISGLYAAGEVTGGVHGACRLGSCATADCLINGRIAGQKAAAETIV